MDLAEGRVGAWQTSGPLGWTFPVAVISLVGGIGCLLICVAYVWLGSHIACDEKGRLIASFAVPVAVGAAALPLAAVRSVGARVVLGIAGGLVGIAFSWYLIHLAFATHFC
jgi:hypothetical protein